MDNENLIPDSHKNLQTGYVSNLLVSDLLELNSKNAIAFLFTTKIISESFGDEIIKNEEERDFNICAVNLDRAIKIFSKIETDSRVQRSIRACIKAIIYDLDIIKQLGNSNLKSKYQVLRSLMNSY